MHAFYPIIFGIYLYQLSSQNQKSVLVGENRCDNSKYITKKSNRREQEKSLGCQDRYQALKHETLPLSLGQHKAKTQPRQLTNMVADDSRLPHSSFNSSHLLPIIPINSTHLSPHRPHQKGKKKFPVAIWSFYFLFCAVCFVPNIYRHAHLGG